MKLDKDYFMFVCFSPKTRPPSPTKSSVERPGRRLAIICEYSAIWSPSVIQRCGIGVERGVVRGVTTGEVNKLKVVGLITPLKGLRFRYDICNRNEKINTKFKNDK